MSENKKAIEITQFLKVPVEQVYTAFTNRRVMQGWFADVMETDAKENGRFYAWWNEGFYTTGQFKEIEENKKITFSWQGMGDPHPTEVEVLLSGENGTTEVKITHKGFSDADGWNEGAVENYKKEWVSSLANLQSVLERGVDKRVYDRPMLGVYPGALVTPEEAEEKGYQEEYGCHLTGTVEGMGAAQAGLQSEDIILSIAGVDIKTFPDFGSSVEPHKAGDVVEVVYLRDNKKQTVDMKLSGRPMPDAPATVKELGKIMREVNAELDKELDEIFAGVSLEEASKRPEENEWCAREVVAHLIYTERWVQLFVSTINDNQRVGGFFNDHGTVKAIADGFPTNAALLEALKRDEETTIAAIEALPDEFVARKEVYVPLADSQIQGGGQHHRIHFKQMRQAIAAARGE